MNSDMLKLKKMIEIKIKNFESNTMYPAYGMNSQVAAFEEVLKDISDIKMVTDETLKEQIEDLLYSVQNKQGNSHLFGTDLCNSVTNSIMEIVKENFILQGKRKDNKQVKEDFQYEKTLL